MSSETHLTTTSPNQGSSSQTPLILQVDNPRAKIYQGSCLDALSVLNRSSVSLIITSPPYPGVAQPEEDYVTFDDPTDFNASHDFLGDVWKVCYSLLEDLGHLCVNIYDIPAGSSGMYPNVAAVQKRALDIGFVLREEFIWAKGSGYSPPSGSWPLPKGVLGANTWEMVLVFQKPLEFSQRRVDPAKIPPAIRSASLLPAEAHDWLMDTVWRITADREGRALGHPFTYPTELCERLIRLYSFTDEKIFDPFVGSGTTVAVAERLGRVGVGTELSEKYINICKRRLAQGGLF